MMSSPQPNALKGSQKWIQDLVNYNPSLLHRKILGKGNFIPHIRWVSPLKEDGYKEYYDLEFLKILGLEEYKQPLSEFWPQSGPRWDALGVNNSNQYFLVEAKANIPEIFSSCGASDKNSIEHIQVSLSETKAFLRATQGQGWFTGFYQYANRISHLYFLREKCGLDVFMIFLYFCNDPTYKATTYEEWKGALQVQKQLMSLNRHKLQKYVLELFIDAEEISKKG